MSLFAELKRRNVIRMGALYALASWVILQVAELLFNALGVPEWGVKLVIGLLLLGFPLVLIFSWVYELTPEGLKRETEVDRSRSITHKTGRKINVLIAGLLVAAIATVLYDRFIPRTTAVATAPAVTAPSGDTAPPTVEQLVAAKFGPKQSVAVLPFVNMSADADNEYFSDGLSEELLNLLSRIPELRVAARTSSFSFKDKDVDIPTVGQQLNVAHVLEGSVRKAGNRVRITAQLIKTADGYHMWSDTYDRDLDDIFAIQDEIATAVVEQLRVTLLGAEPVRADVRPTNPQAYEAYLLGRHYHNQSTSEGWERAIAEYNKAIAIAPGYAQAWAGKSLTLKMMAGFGFLPFDEGFSESRQAAEHAIELDPGLDMGHRALGMALASSFEFVGSRDALRRALDLNPGDAENIAAWARFLASAGRLDEAGFELRRAVDRNPLDIRILSNLTFQQISSMQLEQAEQTIARIQAIDPDNARLATYRSWLAWRRGEFDEVLVLTELIPEDYAFLERMNRAVAYHALGRQAEARKYLDELIELNRHDAAFQIAVVYANWGDADKTFEWLDRAVDIRDPGLVELNTSWSWKPYKDDPRWDALLEKTGLKAVMVE